MKLEGFWVWVNSHWRHNWVKLFRFFDDFLVMVRNFQVKFLHCVQKNFPHFPIKFLSIIALFKVCCFSFQEILRMRPAVPLSVPHFTKKRAILRDYIIPKGTIIVTNLWGIQNDEAHWPEPEKFMPERHLDKDGNFQKLDHWIPFNVGARNCVGQQLAKMELLITTVLLFQRFSFSLEQGVNPDMTGQNAVVLRPTHSKLCAQRRWRKMFWAWKNYKEGSWMINRPLNCKTHNHCFSAQSLLKKFNLSRNGLVLDISQNTYCFFSDLRLTKCN